MRLWWPSISANIHTIKQDVVSYKKEIARTFLFIKQFQQTVHFLYTRWQPSFAMPCYLLTTKKSGIRWWPSWFVVQKVNTFNTLMWCFYIMRYVTPAIKPCFNNNCNKSVWKIFKSFCECNEITLYLGRKVYCKWVVAASAPSPSVLLYYAVLILDSSPSYRNDRKAQTEIALSQSHAKADMISHWILRAYQKTLCFSLEVYSKDTVFDLVCTCNSDCIWVLY